MSEIVNDDFTALAELLDATEDYANPENDYTPGSRAEALQRAQDAVLERIRAEVAARSDGLRRAIVWYEKLAEDAKRVMQQSQGRAALIREYVKGEMQAASIKSIKTATGSLTVRGNGGLEPLVLDADELPEEYTKVTVMMPHAVWLDVTGAWQNEFVTDLAAHPDLKIRTEPDNARIREALAKPCGNACESGKIPCDHKNAREDDVRCPDCDDGMTNCPACHGSGRFTIPGARLDPRGQSLVVR